MTLNNSQARLLSFVQRIETLLVEKKEITDHISDVKAQAKTAGFEPKVINQMIKERAMTESDRQEWNALCEMYRAALGMLDGTPMSDNTRRRYEADSDDARDTETPDMFGDDEEPHTPFQPNISAYDARNEGASAFHAGRKITENPYGPHDPARAAWDEGYCAEAGSDGMDIPPAWRRTKPKKEDGKGGEA